MAFSKRSENNNFPTRNRCAEAIRRVLAGAALAALLPPGTAMAQQPPTGRELPIVCAGSACSGGVTNWVTPGADAATRAINGQTMDIVQRRLREIYNWASFDIAEGHTVRFDQRQGPTSIALNRVLGTTNPETFINGNLRANGEVFVINRNGILFGPNAVVDTHSLVASTLGLWDDDALLSGSITDAIAETTPEAAFQGALGTMGDIDVAAGAEIRSAEGGRVLMFAPSVTNRGSIRTPGGQTVLAGSHDKVFLTASADENLRGLVVEVDTGGSVSNLGEIIAERGNVSLVGLAVNQGGTARATSAVNFNGSVRLAARHKAGPANIIDNGGLITINSELLATTPEAGDPEQNFGVVLGPDSVTEVTPEIDSDEAVIDASPFRPAIVEVFGKRIELQANAAINAPAGRVDLQAVPGAIPGQVILRRGASIDVSGTESTVLPMSRNLGTIELRGNELADSPVQRDGVLRGQEIKVDIRKLDFVENSPTTTDDDQYFIPIGQVTAVVDGIRRTIEERSAIGGTVNITGQQVDLQAGSRIDVSGGRVTFEGGFLESTLVVAEGQVFDIAEAPADLVYDGILPFVDVTYERWGVQERFNVFGEGFELGSFEPGYIEGRDAGSVVLNVEQLTLEGDILGRRTAGIFQRNAPGITLPGRPRFHDELPLAGSLQIGQVAASLPFGPASVSIGTLADDTAEVNISQGLLTRGGINRLRITSPGDVLVGDLSLADGGSLDIVAGQSVSFDGAISAVSGSITAQTLQPPGLRPPISVSDRTRVDLSGRWINDLPELNSTEPRTPLFIDGGSFALSALGDLTIGAGASLRADSGAHLSADNILTGGQGGSISLRTQPDEAELVETILTLGASLSAFGVGGGGSLTLAGSQFVIGEAVQPTARGGVALSPSLFSDRGFADITLEANAIVENFDEPLIVIAPDTSLDVRTRLLVPGEDFRRQPTGTDLRGFSTTALPELVQRQPSSLTLSTSRAFFAPGNALFAGISTGSGSAVRVNPQGRINLQADDRIVLGGALIAPAGDITARLVDGGEEVDFRAQGIWMTDTASADVSGLSRIVVDAEGRRSGDVLVGGAVRLQADRGYVVTAPGARVNANGASGTVDLVSFDRLGLPLLTTETSETSGGSISLVASEGILPYGAMRAAGGGNAPGGLLEVRLDIGNREGNAAFAGGGLNAFPETERIVALGAARAFDPVWLDFDSTGFSAALLEPAVDGGGALAGPGVDGLAVVDPARVVAGGFDFLNLGARQVFQELRADGVNPFSEIPAEIRLTSSFSLNLDGGISFDAPVLSATDVSVNLAAPRFSMGSDNRTFRVSEDLVRNLFEPTGGLGQLTVNADLIDIIGFSSTRGFGSNGSRTGAPISLNASADIRLRGIPVPGLSLAQFPEIQGRFETVGDLELNAARIYPTTLTEFDIALRGEDALLSIGGVPGTRDIPLSAGGRLTLQAQHIRQGGTVMVPFGSLDLVGALSSGSGDIPQVFENAGNAGAAGATSTIINAGALTASDYRLTHLGGPNFELRRLSDGVVTAINSGGADSFSTPVVDGFRLNITRAGQATPGDSFLVRPSDEPVAGTVTLVAGSLTSTSGAGVTVPVGELLLENNWTVTVNNVTRTLDEPRIFSSNPTALELAQRPFNEPDRPWTKQVTLTADSVAVNEGAILDVSGGGDLIASEFRPGPGGSQDILFGAPQSAAFALVPQQADAFAPADVLRGFDGLLASELSTELPEVDLDRIGMMVEIGPGSDLPAGTYTIMPRDYALLPGAFLATAVPDSIGFQPADAGVRTDGAALVSARYGVAGSASRTRASGLVIETREQVLNRAEYLVAEANGFFSDRAEARGEASPQLPVDGGIVAIAAGANLDLQGALAPNLAPGRSTQVDIAGDDIRIVQTRSASPAGIELLADGLNGFGAESLLIGGRRAIRGSTLELDISTDSIIVDGDVSLVVPELLLAALDEVRVEGGASLEGRGAVRGLGEITFAPNADGSARSRAIVRVSGDEQVAITGAGAPGGNIAVEAGATLFADGSITLDATDGVLVEGALGTDRGAIALGTSRISIGAVPGGTPGLVLESLDELAATDLRLSSTSSIDFYGAVPLNATLENLVLDTEALRGFNTTATVRASNITVTNTRPRPAVVPNTGTGSLTLVADVFTLAGGTYDFGFDSLSVDAATVQGSGDSSVLIGGDLQMRTDRLAMLGGSDLGVDVSGTAALLGLSPGASTYALSGSTLTRQVQADQPLGGALDLRANRLTVNTTVSAASGRVSLAARGAGEDLALGSRAVLDVAGSIQRFDGFAFGTAGGDLSLTSLAGQLLIDPGARLDIAGAAAGNAREGVQGGNAGSLRVTIPDADLSAAIGNALMAGVWVPSTGERQALVNPVAVRASANVGALDSLRTGLAADGVDLSTAELTALGGFAGGSFIADSAGLTTGLDGLADALADAGIGNRLDLRLREGSHTLGGEITAAEVSLAADRGSLAVAGSVDASGSDGGRIDLHAGEEIVLTGRLAAAATSADGTGGQVTLTSRDGWVELASGAAIDVGGRDNGVATADGLVRINVPRNTAANLANDNGGTVVPLLATINGAGRVEVVANTTYTDRNTIVAGAVDAGSQIGIDAIRGELQTFITQAGINNLKASLDPGSALGASLHLLPGVEIRTPTAGSTDLTLATDWDFADDAWRFDGEAGVLTLRAAGDLLISNDLSDGIALRDNLQSIPSFSFDPLDFPKVATLLRDDSWSFRLVAGADLQSASAGAIPASAAAANPLQRRGGADGSLQLGAGARIRTGTGSIDIAAAGDIDFADDSAAILTLGRSAGFGNIGFDTVEADVLGQFFRDWVDFQLQFGFNFEPVISTSADTLDAPFFFDFFMPGAVYGEDGGAITIAAGGNINGPGTNQLTNQWLVSLGGTTEDNAIGGTPAGRELPTLWAVVPEQFRQNLGSLGGGDVALAVDGDVTDFSVMLPSTGQQTGEGFEFGPSSSGFTASGTNEVTVLGGGDLDMRVGGDFRGGQLLLGRGDGRVRANGEVAALEGSETDLIVMLGDASLDVQAGEGLTLEAAFNFSMLRRPTLEAPSGAILDADTRPFFFTYEQGNALAVGTLSGDILLENANDAGSPIVSGFLGGVTLSAGEQTGLRVHPGSFDARALAGNIRIDRGFTMFPDPDGTFRLLADGNVNDQGVETANAPLAIIQSDADVNDLPSAIRVDSVAPVIATTLSPLKSAPVNDAQRRWHATVPVHLADRVPSRIVARRGSIGIAEAEAAGFRVMSAEQTQVSAGRDIIGLDVEFQNVTDADTSTIIAGRDIRFLPNRNIRGQLAQDRSRRNEGILFTGPGRGLVSAGRNIDLGTSDGIVSVGNLRNLNLPDTGADISVLAGTGSGSDLGSFFNDYIVNLPADDEAAIAYLGELFTRGVGAEGEPAGAGNSGVLPRAALEEALADVRAYAETLRAQGVDTSRPQPGLRLEDDAATVLLDAFFNELRESGIQGEFARGVAAARTLFPDGDADGSLSLLLSRIHTEDGGDINLFVPGGSANAGAATTDAVTKNENQLGIVVQQDGDVSGFVRDDFFVNASRVFALQGGNILLWASTGDIDAGRGAKSALAAPPPQVVFDPSSGQFITVFPPEVSGSGIRNFAPPGVTPGDVFLFAPQGVVSAGDAGIASAGNITIVATEVVGADNIQVGGNAIGVPQGDVGGLAAGLTGVSNTANAAQQSAQESTGERAGDADGAGRFEDSALSIITVEVLGFGG